MDLASSEVSSEGGERVSEDLQNCIHVARVAEVANPVQQIHDFRQRNVQQQQSLSTFIYPVLVLGDFDERELPPLFSHSATVCGNNGWRLCPCRPVDAPQLMAPDLTALCEGPLCVGPPIGLRGGVRSRLARGDGETGA